MRRSWLTVGLAALCVAVAAPTHAWASTSGASAPRAVTAAARTVVDMEATVLAAQIDPRRADHTLTPGAKDSVPGSSPGAAMASPYAGVHGWNDVRGREETCP